MCRQCRAVYIYIYVFAFFLFSLVCDPEGDLIFVPQFLLFTFYFTVSREKVSQFDCLENRNVKKVTGYIIMFKFNNEKLTETFLVDHKQNIIKQ